MNLKRPIAAIALMVCVYCSLAAFPIDGVNYSAHWENGTPTYVYVTSVAKSAGEHVIIPEKVSWWDQDRKEGFQNIPVTHVKITGPTESVKKFEAPHVIDFQWGGRALHLSS